MRDRLLLLAFAALAAVPLLTGPMHGQDNKKGIDYPSEWFPLKVGDSKVYIGGDPKDRSTVSVEKAESIRWKVKDRSDLVVGYVLKTTSGDKMLIEDVFVTPDGVYRRSAAGKEINPPIKILKLPPTAGDTWPIDSDSESIRLIGTFSVDKATLELPGRGATETFLVTTNEFYAGKEKLEMKTWFAKDLGIVKQHVKVSKFELKIELAAPNTPAPSVPSAKIDPKKAFPSAPPTIVAPPAGSVPAPPVDTLRPAVPMPPPALPKLPEIPAPPAPPPTK